MAKNEATVTQEQVRKEMLELAHELIEKIKDRSSPRTEIPYVIELYEAASKPIKTV